MPTTELQGTRGRVVLHSWPHSEPTFLALLAHGYGEHARRYEHLAARLVDAGAAVYAPDHLGHGLSEGERALVEDSGDMVEDLRRVHAFAIAEQPGLPVVLIGHSMGGLIAASYAQQHGDGLAALVLSGPAIGANPDILGLLQMDPMPEIPIDPAALSRDPAVGEAYMSDDLIWHGPFRRTTLESFGVGVEKVASGPKLTMPTLWIHGSEDTIVPLPYTRETIELIHGTDFEEKIYEGARHEVFNETNRDEVLDDVVGFLQRKLG